VRKLIIVLICVQIGFCNCLFAQGENLIADPGFELYDSCVDNICQNDSGWCTLVGSVDLYTYCDLDSVWGWTNERMIPNNILGYQYPYLGKHYSGFLNYHYLANNIFELPSIKLPRPIEKDKRYVFEFYLSLADSVWYGSRNIGVCFYNSSKLTYLSQITAGPEINMSLFDKYFLHNGPILGPI
jgi:hypothetical protein